MFFCATGLIVFHGGQWIKSTFNSQQTTCSSCWGNQKLLCFMGRKVLGNFQGFPFQIKLQSTWAKQMEMYTCMCRPAKIVNNSNLACICLDWAIHLWNLFRLLYGHLCQENWLAICLGYYELCLLRVYFSNFCEKSRINIRTVLRFLTRFGFSKFFHPKLVWTQKCLFLYFKCFPSNISFLILKLFVFHVVALFLGSKLVNDKPSEVRTV